VCLCVLACHRVSYCVFKVFTSVPAREVRARRERREREEREKRQTARERARATERGKERDIYIP